MIKIEQEIITVVEAYHQDDDGDITYIKNTNDWLLILAAIPFIGTIMILAYFLMRSKKTIIKKIKFKEDD